MGKITRSPRCGRIPGEIQYRPRGMLGVKLMSKCPDRVSLPTPRRAAPATSTMRHCHVRPSNFSVQNTVDEVPVPLELSLENCMLPQTERDRERAEVEPRW